MEYKQTSKVDYHHTNQNYECLLVDLLREPTFHWTAKAYDAMGHEIRGAHVVLTKADLMPTNRWVSDMVYFLARTPGNREFQQELLRLAVNF